MVKRLEPSLDWPPTWRESHPYDCMELWGERALGPGYFHAYQTRAAHTFELLRRHVPAGARVLDLAAAQGNFSLRLAEKGYRVTWNDLRGELEGYVRLKHERGEVDYRPGNLLELDAPELQGAFDAVLATEVIEHVAHPDRFIASLGRFLKPGGVVVMTTPNGAYLRNTLPRFSDFPDPSVFEGQQFRPNADGHIFLLHPDEVPRLARQAGFDVVDLRLHTTFLTNGHVKTGRVLPWVPARAVEALERASARLPPALKERLCTSMAFVLKPAAAR